MTEQERTILAIALANSCAFELPDSVHTPLGTIARLAGVPEAKAVRVLDGLAAFGFRSVVKDFGETSGFPSQRHIFITYAPTPARRSIDNPVEVVDQLVRLAGRYYCYEHRQTVIIDGDFSHLSPLSEHNGHCRAVNEKVQEPTSSKKNARSSSRQVKTKVSGSQHRGVKSSASDQRT